MKLGSKIAISCLMLCVGVALAAQEPTPESKGETLSAPARTPKIATPQRVRVSQAVSNGLVVRRVYPHYPPEARKGHIQGAVVMYAIISKAGDIETLELASGDPVLAPAAIDAVKQWKYKPYLLNGKAVEVDTQIQVNFTLSGN
jgi:periplasmic protein TonB